MKHITSRQENLRSEGSEIAQHRYDPRKVEAKWQEFWESNKTFKTSVSFGKPKYYVLDMFPYPSGAGLHVGHPEGYTATDIVARYKRMNGYNVLHPIGWDAFGLPAERAAIREGRHPAIIIEENITNFRRQLKQLGFSYDWDRELSTTDPKYYKWTQKIFLKLFELGLAYLAEVPVNWCAAQGTVLANEEVQDGRYIETGDPVERRLMRQWMLKITAYADRLLEDLDLVDWPESVIEMQRQWIGRSEGAEINFSIPDRGLELKIFTTRPETIFGATYCVLAPEHPLIEKITSPGQMGAVGFYLSNVKNISDREREISTAKEKTGVFTGAFAKNPITQQLIPVWIADYVKMEYGTGAIMAVPAHDQRDFEFAKAFDLRIVTVVKGGAPEKEAYLGGGSLINSGFLNGLDIASGKMKMLEHLLVHDLGKPIVSYRLRDWLFSRQRYWGEPFPLVYGEDGRIVPIPDGELPITLPMISEFKPTADGRPPLARAEKWTRVEMDGKQFLRETNTMPQWAGSCWYYLRFMDPHNDREPFSREAEEYWSPVDLYIGGVEHAVLHLLYARFWHKVMYDCGWVHTKEPFRKLFNQGFILGISYSDSSGKYYREADVEYRNNLPYVRGSDITLIAKTEKMSKSRLNVVNPDDVVEKFGADSLRLYEMFMGPLESTKPWQTNSVSGVYAFLSRSWSLIVDAETGGIARTLSNATVAGSNSSEMLKELHKTVAKVTNDIEGLKFNTAIARMMEFLNYLKKQAIIPQNVVETYLLLLSPFAPHIAEELWQRLGHSESLAYASWPRADEALIKAESATVVVQINGKRRATIEIPVSIEEVDALRLAMNDPVISSKLSGFRIRKKIYVKNRLINFVGEPGT